MPARDVQGRRLADVLARATPGASSRLVEAVRAAARPREEARSSASLPRAGARSPWWPPPCPATGDRAGTVVVFEDLTQILATQRLEAWKEAVERVIHEIKNPLTPVGLAAQTLKTAHAQDRARFDELFPSAIDMMLSAVRDLKELITEFSRFSRLPAGPLERCEVNELVADALALYAQRGPRRASPSRWSSAADLPAWRPTPSSSSACS